MNLIVFDIDDTLTKSENQHQVAFMQTMKEFGIDKINDNWADYEHYTDSHILKVNYERNFPRAFDFSFLEDFQDRMMEIMQSLSKVSEIPGAKTVVDFFDSHANYALAFATGSLWKPAVLKLNQAEILFDEKVCVGSNAHYTREDIVKHAIEKAKEKHRMESFEHIISVGDGIWDLKTAKNLGLHFMGIGRANQKVFHQEGIAFHMNDWTEFNLENAEQILGI